MGGGEFVRVLCNGDRQAQGREGALADSGEDAVSLGRADERLGRVGRDEGVSTQDEETAVPIRDAGAVRRADGDRRRAAGLVVTLI